jgi:hypothetical protein
MATDQLAQLTRSRTLQPLRQSDAAPVMREGHITDGVDLIVGLGQVDEVPVIEERLPVVEIGVVGSPFH